MVPSSVWDFLACFYNFWLTFSSGNQPFSLVFFSFFSLLISLQSRPWQIIFADIFIQTMSAVLYQIYSNSPNHSFSQLTRGLDHKTSNVSNAKSALIFNKIEDINWEVFQVLFKDILNKYSTISEERSLDETRTCWTCKEVAFRVGNYVTCF